MEAPHDRQEVHVDGALPRVHRQRLGPSDRDHADVVHHDVDAVEPLDGDVAEARRSRASLVTSQRHRRRFDPELACFVFDGPGALDVDVGDHGNRPLPREGEGGRAPDATPTTRDHRDAAAQLIHRPLPRVQCSGRLREVVKEAAWNCPARECGAARCATATAATSTTAAAELEGLGYSAIWVPGGVGGDIFGDCSALLEATETGRRWRRGSSTSGCTRRQRWPIGHAALTAAHPGRFLLGLGVSHSAVGRPRGRPGATASRWR